MLALGGSVATMTVAPSFLPLQNPGLVNPHSDLSGVALYYNATLTEIGTGRFSNASLLLERFRFVNLPSSVNGTAQFANADLASVNSTIPRALAAFAMARMAIERSELVNATALVKNGCAFTSSANSSLTDFGGPQTSRFQSESVPTSIYALGQAISESELKTLHGVCVSLSMQLPSKAAGPPLILIIGAAQSTVETGGPVLLQGNLTRAGTSLVGQKVYFYGNGSYFGSMFSDSLGKFSGTLDIPFVYSRSVWIQAIVAPNATLETNGAQSNSIFLTVLFNATSIVVSDPPSYLPGDSFNVHGYLATSAGVPLPDAPIGVSFLRGSLLTTTDGTGQFRARFTVPDNTTDGTYFVYVRFSPRGTYGPSFNFTSIYVYHIPLRLSLSVPGLSWAGFSTQIGGTARANGTAVVGADVTLYSPWGTFSTRTDQSGGFGFTVPVSPFELAFSKNVTVSVSPAVPFVAPSKVEVELGLFNILLIILPAAVIGAVGYEANSLGAFEGIRGRVRRRRVQRAQRFEEVKEISYHVTPSPVGGPEQLLFFRRAVALASVRFLITFKPSMTIREMLSLVKSRDSEGAHAAFTTILLSTEDFLYGPKFDPARTEESRKALYSLEAVWP